MKQLVHLIHHFNIHINLPEYLVIINEPVKLPQLLQRSKTLQSSFSISCVRIAKPTVCIFLLQQGISLSFCFWKIMQTLSGFIYETNINDGTEGFLKHYQQETEIELDCVLIAFLSFVTHFMYILNECISLYYYSDRMLWKNAEYECCLK